MAYYTNSGNWRPSYPDIPCATCGAVFTPHSKTQKFCSKGCVRVPARTEKTSRECPTCHKTWLGAPSNPSRFCSKECLKADYRKKRQRVCTVCNKQFEVKRAGREGVTCSQGCLSAFRRKLAAGRTQSNETKVKRADSLRAAWSDPEKRELWSSAAREGLEEWHSDPSNAAKHSHRSSQRMTRLHQNPEFQERRNARSSRVMTENWERYRDDFTEYARARYRKMVEGGTGIMSDESKRRRAEAGSWIMTKAQEALHSETKYNEMFKEVQARLREMNPFCGDADSRDYYDYCKKLGKLVVNSPECRAIADAFMSEAIPRFSREWNARRATTNGD